MRKLNWPLIWQLTLIGLWLGFKSAAIVGSTLIGGGLAFLVIIFADAPNFQKDKFGLILGQAYLAGLGGTLAIGLTLGLLIGFLTGLLTGIFRTHLPTSHKYRIVTIWAAFGGCFIWAFIFGENVLGLRGSGLTAGIILACYGSWISTRLVSFVEDNLLTGPKPVTEAKKIADNALTYRISRLKNEGWSRFEIDRDLLAARRTAEELEAAWWSFETPATSPTPTRQKPDWKSWSKVTAGAIGPIAVVALVCWVV